MAENQSGGPPPERYVNQSRLAAIKGKSRQAIGNAVGEGKLVLHGQGRAARVDLECPLTIAYLAAPSNPGKATAPTPGQAKPKPAKKKAAPPAPAPPATVAEEKNIPPDSPANAERVEAFLNKEEVKRAKVEQELEKLILGNKKSRGELIERALVQLYAHKEDEIDNGQWKTLGLKISSDVAAAIGIDDDEHVRKICDVIDREVLSVLKLVKRERNKFLRKIGAEKIAKGKAA